MQMKEFYTLNKGGENPITGYPTTTFANATKALKVAGVIVSVCCMQLNAEARQFEEISDNTSLHHIEYSITNNSILSAQLDDATLRVSKMPFFSVEYSNYLMLKESFSKNCPAIEQLKYSAVFNMISEMLKSISIKKAFVDIVPALNTLTMDLNLGHKILLSLSKSYTSMDTDEVLFAISVDGDVRASNVMSLTEIVEKVKDIQKNLA